MNNKAWLQIPVPTTFLVLSCYIYPPCLPFQTAASTLSAKEEGKGSLPFFLSVRQLGKQVTSIKHSLLFQRVQNLPFPSEEGVLNINPVAPLRWAVSSTLPLEVVPPTRNKINFPEKVSERSSSREQQLKELAGGRKTWIANPCCKAIYILYPVTHIQK